MRVFIPILLIPLFFNCVSTSLIKSCKNPEYPTFVPKNILVIGVTPDTETRKAFEFRTIKELNTRSVNALQSHVVFEKSFQDSKKTELEIEAQIDKLIEVGYDAILISVVKGIENNISYSGKSSKLDYRLRKFIGYFLAYQDAYFKQNFYDRYNVYTIETSLYSLKNDSDIPRIWYMTYDLVNPKDINKSINNYVKVVIKSLEKEGFISKKPREQFQLD
ncbi:hypothetical protein G3567_12505 [Psychroflexus sp. YR1-1]|uniref:Uncharacterized protein n=1 Tax=Psychroflexus aurantiacus TaxID=2709310 RepID=A0A6B3R5V3_9FLAO|nr:hypothetical protein [Psychroflexus aurantiacus]NEV94960.1 hypothetical protein [Psychroflexus aurantiacus]